MATGVLNLAPKQNEVATYSATQATAAKPSTVGYKPNEFSVTPNQTVAGQLDSVIAKDSPLLQQARRRAKLNVDQAMNDRGMLNSSMAIGAGIEAADAALYDKALPIAQQDAQTYGTASTNTTNAQNAALYSKMQADNAAFMRGAELDTNVSLANADARTKADAATAGAANQFKQTGLETERAYTLSDKDTSRALQLADKEYQRVMATARLDANTRIQIANADNATRLQLANVDRNTRVELATIENNYRQLLQTNQDLATMYNQVSTNISNIAASNLSEGAKADATQTQLNLLRQAVAAKQAVVGTPATTGSTPSGPSAPNVANLNIASYFNNDPVGGTFNQARYDEAMQAYRAQVRAREESWQAWDRGGRSGPWNPPQPIRPNRDDFYDYGTAPASSTTPPAATPRPTGTATPIQPEPAPWQPVITPPIGSFERPSPSGRGY